MRERDMEEDARLKAAKKRVRDLKAFYTHLVVFVLVNLFLLVLMMQGQRLWEGLLDPENYYTAFFWGIGLVAHGFNVFGSPLFLGKEWEERKIKELMEKEKRQKWE